MPRDLLQCPAGIHNREDAAVWLPNDWIQAALGVAESDKPAPPGHASRQFTQHGEAVSWTPESREGVCSPSCLDV